MKTIKVLIKTVSIIISAVFILSVFSGCSSNRVERQSEDIAAILLNEISFSKMANIKPDQLEKHFVFSKEALLNSTVYLSDEDDKADELCVFKLKDSSYEKAVFDEINLQLGMLSKNFSDHFPVEYNKIKNAVIRKLDGYIIVVVCEQYQKADTVLSGMGAVQIN